VLVELQKRGFNRLFQNDRVHEFSSPETLLDVDFSQPVYVLVDRLSVNPESRSRLVDSIEICYREGGGEAILNAKTTARSTRNPSPACSRSTIRSAPARAARASATQSTST
jgi:excinuclease ABC subunit A